MGDASRKRQRGAPQPAVVPVCQVEGCKTDLQGSKKYHRRHRVCELHSKTPKSLVDGIEKRFCQQCSRFHVLDEFDNGKRSCRKRLAGHNERRRKPTQILESIVSSGIFPGEFKPGIVQIQDQHHHHLLDGSFLSSWPDHYQQQQQQQLQDHGKLSLPPPPPPPMYQPLQGLGLYDMSQQQQQQFIHFLRTTTSSLSAPPPHCGAHSLLSGGSPPPPPQCGAHSLLSGGSPPPPPQCGAHSFLSAGQSSCSSPPPPPPLPPGTASASASAGFAASPNLQRCSSHLDPLLQLPPQFFAQHHHHQHQQQQQQQQIVQGSGSSAPPPLEMLVHPRSSSQQL